HRAVTAGAREPARAVDQPGEAVTHLAQVFDDHDPDGRARRGTSWRARSVRGVHHARSEGTAERIIKEDPCRRNCVATQVKATIPPRGSQRNAEPDRSSGAGSRRRVERAAEAASPPRHAAQALALALER